MVGDNAAILSTVLTKEYGYSVPVNYINGDVYQVGQSGLVGNDTVINYLKGFNLALSNITTSPESPPPPPKPPLPPFPTPPPNAPNAPQTTVGSSSNPMAIASFGLLGVGVFFIWLADTARHIRTARLAAGPKFV
jgi:hypothetical protein